MAAERPASTQKTIRSCPALTRRPLAVASSGWAGEDPGFRATPVRLDPLAPPMRMEIYNEGAHHYWYLSVRSFPRSARTLRRQATRPALRRLSAGAAREASPAPAPQGAATARRDPAARGIKPTA